MPVGLHPLEDLLRVVQHRRRGVQRQRAVRRDPGVVPAGVRRPLHGEHVVGEVGAEPGLREDLREPLVGDRVLVRGRADLHGVNLSEGVGLGGGRRFPRYAGKLRLPGANFPQEHSVYPPRRGNRPEPSAPSQRRAAMASPTSEVRRDAPGTRSARSATTASSTRVAASAWPRWSSSSDADRIAAVGSATC